MCWACAKDCETRFDLFGKYEKKSNIFQYQFRVLRKAGYLNNNTNVGFFPFKNYRSDTIENVSLMFLWNFMYVNKFTWVSQL